MKLSRIETIFYFACAAGSAFCMGWAYETLHWVTQ